MNLQPKTKFTSSALAVVLWIISAVLGLQSIYLIKEIFYLIYVSLGGNVKRAETFVPALVFVLALVYLVFIVGTTEYHMKRAGRPESWRLFGWTIAVEVSLLILYYILL